MRGVRLVGSVAAGVALAACDGPRTAPVAAPTTPAPPSLPVFVDVAESAGLLVAANHTGTTGIKDWVASGIGGGAIVLDYDQDGRMDLVVIDGTMLTREGDLEYDDAWRTRVFHNDGGLRFTEVTRTCGVDVKAFGIGGASCDYDADGLPDFYVCTWGPNFLFRNRGDGTFEDVTAKAGVRGGDDEMSTGCAWGDLNGDGLADLYVANYCDQRAFIEKCRADGMPGRHADWHGVKVYVGPQPLLGQRDRLYFGNADGTFTDVSDTHLAAEDPPVYGFQPILTDVEGDGDLDVYVPNDTKKNLLWINDGKGNLTERGIEAGVATDRDGKEQASMGVDAADVNRDGRLDLFVTNIDFDHNTLYLNQTTAAARPVFRDASNAWNVTQPSYLRVSWGTRFLDYDNDGELDLFVACGHVYGEIDDFEKLTGASYRQRCLLHRNTGRPNDEFADVTDQGGPALQMKRVWRGAAFADFDDDGDQDVFVTALNDVPALFRNDGGNRNSFLAFRLVGRGTRRDPAGALVTVRLADGRPRIEELHHGASFCNDNDPRLFFGLGAETTAKSVEVRWPSGATQTFADVAARKFYVVTEGEAALREDVR